MTIFILSIFKIFQNETTESLLRTLKPLLFSLPHMITVQATNKKICIHQSMLIVAIISQKSILHTLYIYRSGINSYKIDRLYYRFPLFINVIVIPIKEIVSISQVGSILYKIWRMINGFIFNTVMGEQDLLF